MKSIGICHTLTLDMINHDLAKIFLEMAELYAVDEVPFKPQAYERASESIGSFSGDIKGFYQGGGIKVLKTIPGVGQGIAEKIEEYIKTGHIREYEKMKKKLPVDIAGLTRIEGVGPKAIKILWEKLRIRNVPDLERSGRQARSSNLDEANPVGFGERLAAGKEFQRGRHWGVPLSSKFSGGVPPELAWF